MYSKLLYIRKTGCRCRIKPKGNIITTVIPWTKRLCNPSQIAIYQYLSIYIPGCTQLLHMHLCFSNHTGDLLLIYPALVQSPNRYRNIYSVYGEKTVPLLVEIGICFIKLRHL